MHILITGAGGFVGQILAEALLKKTDHTLLLTDVVDPPIPKGGDSARVSTTKGDLCDPSFLSSLVTSSISAAFVFHGIMSSGAEANYELGMRVNVDATRALFEAFRATCPASLRVIYASSQAVYGQPLPETVTEAVVPTPGSSYGCEKMVCELLVNDYTRRGFFTGFSLRFPTITVRPGKPTAAASSFLSGMIREPLQGVGCSIPLKDRSFPSWLCSPRTLTANLLASLALKADALPPHKRSINLPGIRVTIQEMMDALEKVGGKEALSLLKEETVPTYEVILRSWPQRFDNSLALGLGFVRDQEFEGAVRDFKDSLDKA
ncbi:hypothetical protein FH972_023529 [Carpinus fangiana]|uniref:NAD-dependent epimerase/dehydratase domain-containing protein n=1 Tax=Carpinus fangiana TaxID=176857 RepID=A0A5N6KW19_9ROSI|nr:hypothetical protein FH972_023529 [Carpinus fangiana]